MIEEQLAKMLGFSSIEEMNLFHDVCIGYQVNKFPSKQECLQTIKDFGLYDRLSQLKI